MKLLLLYILSFLIGYNVANAKANAIKILDIGNSFSEDSNCYIDSIVKATGVDDSGFCLYQLMKPGSSFHDWVKTYNGRSSKGYSFYKVTGGASIPFSYSHSHQSTCNNEDLFKNVLTQVEWDIIIIHQVSRFCYDYSKWHEKDKISGDLDSLLFIIRTHQPNARIDFLLVHAPKTIITKANAKNTDQLWFNIMQSAKKIHDNDGIITIIPVGTAVQNIRQTIWNDEYALCRDGLHLGHGLARYTANCAYYQTIIAPILGVSIIGNTFHPQVKTTEIKKSKKSKPIPITEENIQQAQKAAYLATYFWWKILNPDDNDNLFSQ